MRPVNREKYMPCSGFGWLGLFCNGWLIGVGFGGGGQRQKSQFLHFWLDEARE